MKRWRKKNIRLLIYVVYQKKLPNGTISWIKHPDKKFLPAGYKRDTTAVNPIAIPFNKMKPSGKGDFKYVKENVAFEFSLISFLLI